MPRPPNHDLFVDLRFITNFMLAGCEAPSYLIVEFSREPVLDLVMLFFGLDAFDIVQAMFEPTNQRRRKPARHGRKKPTRPRFPDPNDMIGGSLRIDEMSDAVMKLPGARLAFRVINIFEGAAFGAAVVEGLADVGFEALWGVMNVEPNQCQEFARLSRIREGRMTIAGPGPQFRPISALNTEFASGMEHTPYTATCPTGTWTCSVATVVRGGDISGPSRGRLVIRGEDGRIVGSTSVRDIPDGSDVHMDCFGVLKAGEWGAWEWEPVAKAVELYNTRVLCFGQHDWLDWREWLDG